MSNMENPNETTIIPVLYTEEKFWKEDASDLPQIYDLTIPPTLKRWVLEQKGKLVAEQIKEPHIIAFDYRMLVEIQPNTVAWNKYIKNPSGSYPSELFQKQLVDFYAIRQYQNKKICDIFGCGIYLTPGPFVAVGV